MIYENSIFPAYVPEKNKIITPWINYLCFNTHIPDLSNSRKEACLYQEVALEYLLDTLQFQKSKQAAIILTQYLLLLFSQRRVYQAVYLTQITVIDRVNTAAIRRRHLGLLAKRLGHIGTKNRLATLETTPTAHHNLTATLVCICDATREHRTLGDHFNCRILAGV